jgi:hypothetical protein
LRMKKVPAYFSLFLMTSPAGARSYLLRRELAGLEEREH